jgi:hypothetical protein
MSTGHRAGRLRRRRRNVRHEQRNVAPAQTNELEVTRLAKGERPDVSDDGLDSSWFDKPYLKILLMIGRHQPHCPLF